MATSSCCRVFAAFLDFARFRPPPSIRMQFIYRSTSSILLLLCSGAGLAACQASLGSEEPTSRVVGEDDIPSASTRFRRLTHVEWQRTALDLFQTKESSSLGQVIAEAAAGFRNDPRQGGYLFDGLGDALEVDSSLWKAYQQVAADVAAQAAQDSTLISSLAPATGSEEERATTFIKRFGELAHRRPISETQEESYLALYEMGTTTYEDSPGFEGGIRLVIEAFLQSPYFVYRVEENRTAWNGLAPLDGYERASRLSYFFWGTMPDTELMTAASSGKLDSKEGVREQALRLIEDPKAESSVLRFFSKLLDVDHYDEGISPDSSVYDGDLDAFAAAAKKETEQFIGKEIYQASGSLRDFFTSRTTYVNDSLAGVYGLSGSYGTDFEKAELDPQQRSGVFTQVGFLAANATMRDPDPIHRGVFMARRINCLTIAAPPDMIPPLPTPDGQSNRQLVAEHTEAKGTSCRNCHLTLINPFGFAFENYDAVGAYRDMDGSHQVDASTEVLLEGGRESTPVQNAVELAAQLGSSPAVHECIAGHLIAYAQGRNVSDADEALMATLGSASVSEDVSFRSLMVELAVADSFLNRSAETK